MSINFQQSQTKLISTSQTNQNQKISKQDLDLLAQEDVIILVPRIDKKELEIFTNDYNCIIDEVEFVKIFDLETEMPLPVMTVPQTTNTTIPRKTMPKFLSHIFNRKGHKQLLFPILFVFTLCNIFGQTSLFSDDFTTNQGTSFTINNGNIGNSNWKTTRYNNDWGARINNGILELTNDASATANANGSIFAYTELSAVHGYNTILSQNTGMITWEFNMRQIRDDPSGFTSTSMYGTAFVLATNQNDVDANYGNGDRGIAVILGESGTTDRIRLVRFNGGGIEDWQNMTNMITSNTLGLTDFGTQYLSVRVTYTPGTNTWQLFLRNDGTTAFTHPNSGSPLVLQGSAVYSGASTTSSLGFMGAYWKGSSAANQTAFFDNVTLKVNSNLFSNAINLNSLGTNYSENFNSLATSGVSNSILPTGWYFHEAGSTSQFYAGDNGATSTGNAYSYGATSSTERCFGGLRSTTLNPTIGAKLINNTGSPITSLSISYKGETWRVGAINRPDKLDFQYSLNATSLSAGTWIDVNTLDYTNASQTQIFTGGGTMIHSTLISDIITGLNIPSGSTFWIRFLDTDVSGVNDGMGIDDLVMRPCGNVAAPTVGTQSLCSSASPSVANLTATGSSILWYAASTGGAALAPSTALVNGSTYFASQTISGCESSNRTGATVVFQSNGVWVGDSNDDWNIAGNWCGGVPNSNAAVVSIPSGVTVNMDASPSILSLTVASGAILNAGQNVISIANGGSITNNGTFNSASSEVQFQGAGTLGGLNPITLNNLTVNGNLNIQTNTTISGNLQLNGGGNILNNAVSYNSTGQLSYNQGGIVTASGLEWPTTNSPTKVAIMNNSEILLNEAKTITGNLILTNGILNLGNHHLTLGSNATISGGVFSNSRMIIAEGNGEVRKQFGSGTYNPNEFNFPIGTKANGFEYTPVVLDFESSTFGVNAFVGAKVQDSKNGAINNTITNYLNRNWIIEPSNISNFTYKIKLYYQDSDFITDGSMAEGDLLPIKISSGQWYQPTDGTFSNAISQGFAGVFANANYLEWNGLTTFSEFGGAGGNNQPLPVELLSFSSTCIDNNAVLNWQTASEYNSSYFIVEKSIDGIYWHLVGQVSAAGNSNELINYTFIDQEKSNGYYRLNQVDIDGKNEYFGPVEVSCEQHSFKAHTLPNPSNSNFWIQITSDDESPAYYEIKDVKGNTVFQHQIAIQKGLNLYHVNSSLPSGMYFIRIVSENEKSLILKHLQN